MRIVLFLLLFFGLTNLFAQSKSTHAVFLDVPPDMDGVRDSLWEKVPAVSGFTQFQTRPGDPASFSSEVRVAYDHSALYVFARMNDPAPDSIFTETGQRDQENTNADEFAVFLDTYNDKLNGYAFGVTASGVQLDVRHSPNGEDASWNAVWYSRTKIDEKGWTVEMKIPFSAIRFTTGDTMTWGINFLRGIRRYREISYWNPVNPQVEGLLNQAGKLHGLRNIEPPVRLSVTPYVAGYGFHESDGGFSLSGSAGADIKYGINESFTLDLTLVPDFGQVQSDNLVLNLTPFEVQFNEFRPFFTEGTELFNKGGFFYSRRIGGTPLFYQPVYEDIEPDELQANPSVTQLINALKLSGRTKKGLGIGVFNAVTAPSYAVFDTSGVEEKFLTAPLTNYSVLVADQSLRNNSYISLVNTNVTRRDAYNANVAAGLFRLVNKKNTLAMKGKGAWSTRFHAGDPTGNTNGHEAEMELAKISGKLYASLFYSEKSDEYDINDLGYLAANNIRQGQARLGYRIYKPFWILNYLHHTLSWNYSRLYAPDMFYSMALQFDGNTTIRKYFFSTGYTFRAEPVKTIDHFQARISGYAYVLPENYSGSFWYSSDYRKKLALDGGASYRFFNEPGRNTWSVNFAPRWRLSNKVLLIFDEELELASRDAGYTGQVNGVPLVGVRDVLTYTQSLNGRFAFSPLMNLLLRVRHYWSQAEYSEYALLVPNAEREATGEALRPYVPGRNYDISFNAVNLDLIYTWTFSPGSEMNITYKFAQLNSRGEIFNNYLDEVRYLRGQPFNNSISVKVLYYLDYQTVRGKLKEKG